MGCNQGIDVWVWHQNSKVILERNNLRFIVSQEDWTKAVIDFVKQVEAFYDSCTPKEDIDDGYEHEGWSKFWDEWSNRMVNRS